MFLFLQTLQQLERSVSEYQWETLCKSGNTFESFGTIWFQTNRLYISRREIAILKWGFDRIRGTNRRKSFDSFSIVVAVGTVTHHPVNNSRSTHPLLSPLFFVWLDRGTFINEVPRWILMRSGRHEEFIVRWNWRGQEISRCINIGQWYCFLGPLPRRLSSRVRGSWRVACAVLRSSIRIDAVCSVRARKLLLISHRFSTIFLARKLSSFLFFFFLSRIFQVVTVAGSQISEKS